MGMTSLTIEVGNPAKPDATEKVKFCVDSGALYSVVPAALLKKLGIKPLMVQEFSLANGSAIHREKGIALFRYGNAVGGADVIFGQKGDKMLLGATALEALGLCLDPIQGRLLPLPLSI